MEKKPCASQPEAEGPRPSDPTLDNLQLLYGPPEMFFPSDNDAVALYGPPQMFFPQDNENVDLYGPPFPFDDPEESR